MKTVTFNKSGVQYKLGYLAGMTGELTDAKAKEMKSLGVCRDATAAEIKKYEAQVAAEA